ncbi:MAG: excinuclease ABC subunit A [Sterolibacterium sp.]|jgi:hypothetical protein|nr:excinuclease ABC subunit A [Sterolibacterium sp.]
MNKILTLLLAALTIIATPAVARDTRLMLELNSALAAPDAQSKLDKNIPLFFGEQKHPGVVKELGEWGTNKKTNAFGKSDQKACDWAFLSAVLELQERARKEGGDAVVNIKSNYKSELTSSDTQYMCGAGSLMAGVALKGAVVKLAR